MQSRKSLLILSTLVLCACLSLPAFGSYSVAFSTGGTNVFSWTATVSQGTAVMTFENNEINASSPLFDAVLADAIDLPDMTFADIQTVNIAPGIDVAVATLIPDGSNLTITADVASPMAEAGDTVMSCSVVESGILTVGTNFVAYSNERDDLSIISHVAGYSAVIDGFFSAETQGFGIDLSFSGDASASLFNLLNTLSDGSVSGTLSGQIVAVPEPMMLSLLGLGGLLLHRRRNK